MSSAVLDTNESRHRHRDDVVHVSPVFGTAPDRRSGYLYTCPRCSWRAPVMRWRLGAEHQGDRHSLRCPEEAV